MKRTFLSLAICLLFVLTQAQTNTFPGTGNVGIATNTGPTLGALQIGLPNNSNNYKIAIPGLYNFEKTYLGQYGNGAAALEFINHTDYNNSYGIRLMVNVDQAKGLQFQYAPSVNAESSLAYSTGMFMSGTNGYVGIGTTNPQSLLAVKGTITAQKVVVTQTGWADYVFDSSYQLRPLGEVERFVKDNRHLPEVPTTAEVEKDGMDVGDTQALLLKKIEELTLYIIEERKKTEALEAQIKVMQIKLEATPYKNH